MAKEVIIRCGGHNTRKMMHYGLCILDVLVGGMSNALICEVLNGRVRRKEHVHLGCHAGVAFNGEHNIFLFQWRMINTKSKIQSGSEFLPRAVIDPICSGYLKCLIEFLINSRKKSSQPAAILKPASSFYASSK